MSPKEGLEAIKKLLFDVTPVPAPVDPAPVALATEYKLADGTVCSIDKLEVGGIVSMNGTPCPDGDYTLEDGTALTVAGGLISVVTPKAEVPAEAPADMSQFKAPETPEQFQVALQKFADGATPDQAGLVVIVKALFENVFGWQLREAKEKQLRDQAIASYQAGFSQQTEAIKGLLGIVEELAKKEVAQPAQAPVDFEKMTPLQKFRATK